ncbi:trithorax group protein osa [Cephus cinctus]|uniref:Trithorax group protein osa n=1 Tax=Cephus cinctus TaxID=211228 RepID=A0AAJ7BPS8_CEPCN|nr:trithorax group protein osa [Cephus cinctus]
MAQITDPAPVHCYTNPSFCQQSEYIPLDHNGELPPPPQFQGDDLPPPPPPQQLQPQYGQTNPAFQTQPEVPDRYCYLDQPVAQTSHRRYASLPVDDLHIAPTPYGQVSRYEYIQEQDRPENLQRRGSSRYDFVPHQQTLRSAPPLNQDDGRLQLQPPHGNAGRYAVVPCKQEYQDRDSSWTGNRGSPVRRTINTAQGRYTRVPLQEEDPPALPDRNLQGLSVSPRNNSATQKLHEILATPRKPRSRSEERTLSPKRQHSLTQTGTPRRRALTPGGSPTGRTLSPTQRTTPQGTPQNRALSPNGPQTSTPNKEPSARRCLPLTDMSSRPQDLCPASNCGRLRYVGTAPVDLTGLGHNDPPPRYGYLDAGNEAMPMVSGSPRYQVVPTDQKRCYQSVESAFIARTAVVPPLSPPNSDANTTLASGLEKSERRNAPLLLVLVGILTCGLAIYLSWTQGRKYYFDSATGCGACCALAGACRTLRRTWTGLGLAGLSALSCAGLLLLAAKSPRPGTPLHDVTAGALCGVSLLGAGLALLALLAPRCNFGRHRRVHSWIPRFSP